MIRLSRSLAVVGALLVSAPAIAQWQVEEFSVPVGRGPGRTGFAKVGPCLTNVPIVGAGIAANPICGTGTYQPQSSNLTAFLALSGTGFPAMTAADTWALRTITGTTNEITVTNGAGIAGNPTFSLPTAMTFTGKTVTGGTFSGGNMQALTNLSLVNSGFLHSFVSGGTLTGNRSLTFNINDGNRTINLSGDLTLVGSTTISAFGATLVDDTTASNARATLSAQESNARLTDISTIAWTQGDILYFNGTNLVRLPAGTTGNFLKTLGPGANPLWDTPAGGGDVTGPASSTDNAAARFDSTTGKIIQNSALIVADTTGSLSRSGNGGIPVQGTNTNDSAASGFVGEYLSAEITVGSAVSLSSGTAANVTSVSLTAGDWDVYGTIIYPNGATTRVFAASASLSLTSATSDSSADRMNRMAISGSGAWTPGASEFRLGVAGARFSLASTTTVFLVATGIFDTSTLSAYGKIWARRAR